jgi:hypothetical protein
MFKYIIEIFLVGLLFRFLFRFLLPVFRITAATNGRLRQMQDQMREAQRKANETIVKNNVKKEGDYIDYEEVR